jgi:hypothetical protein
MYNVLKNFDWRLTVKYDARPVIESPLGFGYLAFGEGIKVDAFRKILADKAVDILNGTEMGSGRYADTSTANFHVFTPGFGLCIHVTARPP